MERRLTISVWGNYDNKWRHLLAVSNGKLGLGDLIVKRLFTGYKSCAYPGCIKLFITFTLSEGLSSSDLSLFKSSTCLGSNLSYLLISSCFKIFSTLYRVNLCTMLLWFFLNRITYKLWNGALIFPPLLRRRRDSKILLDCVYSC